MRDVVGVGRRQTHGQREPLGIHIQMVFAAFFAAVSGIGAGFLSPVHRSQGGAVDREQMTSAAVAHLLDCLKLVADEWIGEANIAELHSGMQYINAAEHIRDQMMEQLKMLGYVE